jgi:hypothetical protein
MADYNPWVKTTPKTVACEQNIFSKSQVLDVEIIHRFQTLKAIVHMRLEMREVRRCCQSKNSIQR